MERLRVSGAELLDPDGRPIVLRGYNWGHWGSALPQDAADNAGQGANSVRLPLRWWGEWRPGTDSMKLEAPGHIDPAHLALLDQTIAWAQSQHLWIVLFVDSNHGQGADGWTDHFWVNAEKKQQFIEVWQFLVARYRDAPFIGAWEILPEPRATGVSDEETRAFYDSIIPFIRAIDARTPIVVGPNDGYNATHLPAAYTTKDSNILYTANYFIFDHELARLKDLKGFTTTYGAPVWVNQLGIESGDVDAAGKASRVLAGLNGERIGWAWWTYRVQGTNPDVHGIHYLDPSDGVSWVRKEDWYLLVGAALAE